MDTYQFYKKFLIYMVVLILATVGYYEKDEIVGVLNFVIEVLNTLK